MELIILLIISLFHMGLSVFHTGPVEIDTTVCFQITKCDYIIFCETDIMCQFIYKRIIYNPVLLTRKIFLFYLNNFEYSLVFKTRDEIDRYNYFNSFR